MLDFATILGCILGVAVLAVGLLLGGVNLQLVFQPEAIVIVCGGTFTALLLQFSLPTLWAAVGALRSTLKTDILGLNDISDYMVDAANFIRHNGILAMQPLLDEIEIPFLKQGFELLIDNTPEEQIRAQLTARMEVAFQEETEIARVFESAAGFTPTMGVLGAVIGLITALGSFESAQGLSSGIAGAFMSTLYGVGIANLFLIPISGKLNQKARRSWFLRSVMLLGIISLSRNEHPSQLRTRLESYQSEYQSKSSKIQDLRHADQMNPDNVVYQASTSEAHAYQEVY